MYCGQGNQDSSGTHGLSLYPAEAMLRTLLSYQTGSVRLSAGSLDRFSAGTELSSMRHSLAMRYHIQTENLKKAGPGRKGRTRAGRAGLFNPPSETLFYEPTFKHLLSSSVTGTSYQHEILINFHPPPTNLLMLEGTQAFVEASRSPY
jgi:hypothetical protein